MNSHSSMSAHPFPTPLITPILVIESAKWKDKPKKAWEVLIKNLLNKAVDVLSPADKASLPLKAELNVVLMDDKGIAHLNETWRHKKGPTNVLAFPVPPLALHPDVPNALGDIVVAYETIQREAIEQGKPFENHVQHLIIHGFLHLLGHDHESKEEADIMEECEIKVLHSLNIPNPYD